jgi:hypothetical protein
VLRLRRVE